MNFTELAFLPFLATVLVGYWAVRDRRLQNLWLLGASLVFYGWHDPRYIGLLLFVAAIDYLAPLAMRAWPRHRNAALVLSLVANLGTLALFKYLDFFLASFLPSVEPVGLPLPVGISFFTFQSMSYTIDAWRGRLEPRRSFVDYFAYIAMFPQLVAGPVERARDLLPQLEAPRRFKREAFAEGISLALRGAVKKVVIADTLALYVDTAFAREGLPGPVAAAATLAFAVQILADFSGYTDIARGVARMLGFELIENFKHPYLSANPSEFWKRWHVSFSTWIRDYLYIPTGGSRGGFWATTRSTFIAMVLSGLWHGAAWTFILWGAYHAALLTGYRLVTRRIPDAIRNARPAGLPLGEAAAVVIMFGFTLLGWMIFRETRLDRLTLYLSQSPFSASPDEWVATWVMLGVCAFTAAPMVAVLCWERFVQPRLHTSPWYLPIQTTGWAVAALGIFVFYRNVGNDFIYFQF